MKLKKLMLKNVRSYKHEEIMFPEGTILLAGDIGSGKTSILLAIEYALFGLQPGQRGSSILRNSADYGEVSLEFEISGKNITIERKLKRNHKSVTNESASIKIDNERIDASITEIKIKVLELIGYPQEFIKKNNLLYRYTVYTPQEQMKQIIMEDAETRLNILRHILGIDKYRKIRENLVLFLNNLKEDSKLLQGEIKDLDEDKIKLESRTLHLKNLEEEKIRKMQNLDSKIDRTKKIESEALQLELKIKEKEYLEKEIEKIKIITSNKHENYANLENEFHELKKSISEAEVFNEDNYRLILESISQKNKKIEELNAQYFSMSSEISSLKQQQHETTATKERIFNIDLCPTCLQDVPENHKYNILNKTEDSLNKARQRIIFLEKETIIFSKEIEKYKLEKSALEEEKISKEVLRTKSIYLEKEKKRLQQLISAKEEVMRDIRLFDNHILILKEKISELSKFDNLLKLKKLELQAASMEERKAEIFLAQLNKEIDLTKTEIASKEKSINTKEKSKQNLAFLQELFDWLSLSFLELMEFTERNVLIKLRQEFSRIFSKWFDMLVQQGSLTVRLDESFSPIIIHNGIEMEYSFLSGGERTAIALAYRLALNQIINSMLSRIKTKDIVILDEPTDGFSETQLGKMRDILQELKVSQLIIVSHEQKIESFVDNIIRIKKVEEISHLEHNNIHPLKEDELKSLRTIEEADISNPIIQIL